MGRASPEWVNVEGLPRRRKTWQVDHLDIVDEPMFLSLVKYRMPKDRVPSDYQANVVSSHIQNTKLHAPILDLDFPHTYVASTTRGNAHLYLHQEEPSGRIRLYIHRMWVVLLHGYWNWVLRR